MLNARVYPRHASLHIACCGVHPAGICKACLDSHIIEDRKSLRQLLIGHMRQLHCIAMKLA